MKDHPLVRRGSISPGVPVQAQPGASALRGLRRGGDPAQAGAAEGAEGRPHVIFDPSRLLLIAGPCSLENEDVCRAVAQALTSLAQAHPELRIVFKGSFDKANRTSGKGARGTGLAEGLALLALVRREYGFPVLTERARERSGGPGRQGRATSFRSPPSCRARRTCSSRAAGTGRVVNVKKGQFLSPQEMEHVTAKLRQGGRRGDLANGAGHDVWLPQPGGRHALLLHHEAENGCPTVFDVTHSVQLPGAAGGKSGGQREFAPPLARAALAAGADGLFIETRSRPRARAERRPNMIPLKELPGVVAGCIAVWKTVRSLGRLLTGPRRRTWPHPPRPPVPG